MNEMTVFENPEFGKVRTLAIDGEPWFVGKDVAEILGYERGAKAVADHVDIDDRDEVPIQDTIGRMQNTVIVNESGLYSLIIGSKLPTAKKFKRWVTSEVLPTIRKTGAYSTRDSYTIDDPIERAKRWIEEEQERKQLETKVSCLTVSNEIMRPKAEYFDELVDRSLLTNLRDTAKELHVRQSDFVKFLLDKKYLYRDKKGKLLPHASHVNDGIFELKEFTNEKTGYTSTQTLVTPKGKETFRLLMLQAEKGM